MTIQTSIALETLDAENVYVQFSIARWDVGGSLVGEVKRVECEYEITDCQLSVGENEIAEFLPDYDEMYVHLCFSLGHGLSPAEMQGCFEVFKRVLRAKYMTI